MTPKGQPLLRPGRRRLRVAALLTALLALTAAGATVAWLTAQSTASNAFALGMVQPSIVEDFPAGATVKQHVRVKNEARSDAGALDVYVRALVVVSWQGPGGTQLWDKPVLGSDYTMVGGPAGGSGAWVDGSDGFSYWNEPLASASFTDDLIASCQQIKTYDDGRKLVVDIAVQGIQAQPARAAQEAWGAAIGLDGALAPASRERARP